MKKLLLLISLFIGGSIGLYAQESSDTKPTEKKNEQTTAESDDLKVWKDFFGKDFQNNKGKPAKLDVLKGKIVGIYFSASWCPPCRQFTPKLVEFRNKNKDKFEVVLVGSDETEKDHLAYLKDEKMQWYTVNFDGKAGPALKKKYGIKGIPTLIILDQKGNTITAEGRADVTGDPNNAIKKWEEAAKSK